MPTYVYGCDACGHRFEQFQKFSDDPIRVCPNCQGAVRRIFQPAGIVFKGSGWHVTDYKRASNGGGESAKSEGQSASTETTKDETKAAEPAPASTASPNDTAKPVKASS